MDNLTYHRRIVIVIINYVEMSMEWSKKQVCILVCKKLIRDVTCIAYRTFCIEPISFSRRFPCAASIRVASEFFSANVAVCKNIKH